MHIIHIPWYLIFVGLALVVGSAAYLLLRLALRNARLRRTYGVRAIARGADSMFHDGASDVRSTGLHAADDVVILGAAGHDFADPHHATGIYDSPAGQLQD